MHWLLILVLFALPVEAQTRSKPAAPSAVRWPIASVAIQGNQRYSRAQVLAVLGLRVGQMAGKDEFEAARDRLLATGVFESVAYRFEPSAAGKGYAATFEVAEVAQVYPFRFEGLPVSPDDLQDALKQADPLFSEKIPATQKVLERYVGVIERILAEKNFREKVTGKLTADDPEHIVIVFRPDKPLPSVAEVKFVNNRVLPAATLQNAIAGPAIGSVFSEKRFRQILEMSVRPIYETRGRIRVAFPKITTEKSQSAEGLVVTVEVDEGESYALGEVQFQGGELPEEDLRKAGDFKSGDVANFEQIAAGIERIKQRLGREGFLRAETRIERKVDGGNKTVDLVVHVDKGPQFLFGTLMTQGLGLHADAEIKRLWTLKAGQPFDASYPDYFLQTIRERGVFDNLGKTKSEVKIDDEKWTVDVTLMFY